MTVPEEELELIAEVKDYRKGFDAVLYSLSADANVVKKERRRMDKSQLAKKMLDWEMLKGQLDILTAEIEAAVLELAETQTVGNVRASYSGGRKKYDYESAGKNAPPIVIANNTVTIPATTKTDWRFVCQEAEIDNVPFTQSPPSVTVKLLEE